MEPLEQELDEAFNRWGAAAQGVDPLLASFTYEPHSPVRPHVPFYRFFAYPDILDLRGNGFEIDRFIPVFDALDDARYSQAQRIHELLHLHQDAPNPIWNPRRAREIEFSVRSELHRFGISDVPTLLRRMLGRAFPEESLTHLSIDLLHAFFWSALAEVARDYAWQSSHLAAYADYLAYPVRAAGIFVAGNTQSK